MSQSTFRAELGFGVVDADGVDLAQFISETGAPGSTTLTDNAPIGSTYSDATSGLMYRKNAAGAGASKWIKILDENSGASSGLTWLEPAELYVPDVFANLAAAEAYVNAITQQTYTIADQDRLLFDGITGQNKNIFVVSGTPGSGATLVESDHAPALGGDQVFIEHGDSAGVQFAYNEVPDTWTKNNQSNLDELGFIRTFIGKGAAGNELPAYTSVVTIANGDPIETAVGKLDAALALTNTAVGTNTTNIGNLQTEVDAIELSWGSSINANGTYAGFSGTNFIDGNASLSEDLTDLDTAIQTATASIGTLQTEVDNIETGLGTAFNASGVYQPFTGTNYIDGNASLTEDLTDLDAQAFSNAGNISTNTTNIGNLQTEVDNIETSMGAVVDASGNYVTFAGTNYLDGNATVTEDLTDLDTQINTNATDITALQGANGDEANIRSFIGKAAAGVETPTYSSALVVTQSTDLEAAIGELDLQLGRERQEFLGTGTFATFTAIDSFLVDDIKWVEWTIVMTETATQDTKAWQVSCVHDGLATADATDFDENRKDILKVNGTVNGGTHDIALAGTGAAQTLTLSIKADSAMEYKIIRRIVMQ